MVACNLATVFNPIARVPLDPRNTFRVLLFFLYILILARCPPAKSSVRLGWNEAILRQVMDIHPLDDVTKYLLICTGWGRPVIKVGL